MMMSEQIKTKKSGMGDKSQVFLRVYDVSDGAAKIWSPIVLGRRLEGVWHSGVSVFGFEYFYGGGIVKMKPATVEATFGLAPAKIHFLGYTEVGRLDFEKYLVSIMPMFRKECYDLLNWNCNNFADHIVNHLTGRSIPQYITDLPADVAKTIMGKLVLNFIKMINGGTNPITVDHPAHPKQVLGARERRNSSPASPSARPISGDSRNASFAAEPVDSGGARGRAMSFGADGTGSGVRAKSLNRAQTAHFESSSPPQMANVANVANVQNRESLKYVGETFRSNRAADARRGVSFWDRERDRFVPAAESEPDNDADEEEEPVRVKAERLADAVDCEVSVSPRHKRLYRMQREEMMQARPPARPRAMSARCDNVQQSMGRQSFDFQPRAPVGVVPSSSSSRTMKRIIAPSSTAAPPSYGRRDRRSQTMQPTSSIAAI